MAEGLGATAAMLEVLAFALKTFEYIQAVKNATRDQLRLAEEVESVIGLMTKLYTQEQETATRLQKDPQLQARYAGNVPSPPFKELIDILQYLQGKLQPDRKKVSKLFFPGKKQKLEEIFVRIERCKSTISIALATDTRELVQETRIVASEINENVTELLDLQHAQLRSQVINWFSPTSFALPQTRLPSLSRGGVQSETEFLRSDTLWAWMNRDNGKLWCSGIPGVGKTVMAFKVVQHIRETFKNQRESIGVAGMFCDYKLRETQTLQSIAASIWRELASGQPTLSETVRQLHRDHALTEPMEHVVMQALIEEIQRYSRVFVIMDAWDECHQETAKQLIAFLDGRVNIFVTSRPTEVPPQFKNDTVELEASEADMTEYVRTRVAASDELAEFVERDQQLLDDIIYFVVSGDARERMFLLAELQMDVLVTKDNIQEVRRTLGSLPRRLDDAYDGALERIMKQDEFQRRRAMQVLRWVLFSFRPLTLHELSHALTVVPGTPFHEDHIPSQKTLLARCAGLVLLDPVTNSVRLVHFTVQTYLEQRRTTLFPHAHKELGEACMAYISCAPRRQYTPGVINLEPEKWILKDYAFDHWGHHVRESRGSVSDNFVIGFLHANGNEAMKQTMIDGPNCIPQHYASTHEEAALCVASSFGLDSLVNELLLKHRDLSQGCGIHAVEALFACFGSRFLYHWIVEKTSPIIPTHGVMALHYAATAGHTSTVRLLIEKGVNLHGRCASGHTVAGLAAKNGHIDILNLMIQLGVSITEDANPFVRRRGPTPLYFAVTEDRIDVAEMLLDNGVDVNADVEGETVIFAACAWGLTRMVEFLLMRGANPRVRTHQGRTPLHVVCDGYSGGTTRVAVGEALWRADVDLRAQDSFGCTALHLACTSGSILICKFLLSRDGELGGSPKLHSIPDNQGRLPLHVIQGPAILELAQLLISSGADPNGKDNTGRAALHSAAMLGQMAFIELLLEAGADINAKDGTGKSVVSYAGESSRAEVVTHLLDRGARVDEETIEHVLQGSNGCCNAETFGLLFERGGFDFHGDSGAHFLHWAASLGSLHVLRYLLKHGADINAVDTEGHTPLHYAYMYEKRSSTDFLIDNGCDTTLRDKLGRLAAEVKPIAEPPKEVRYDESGWEISSNSSWQ